MKEYLKECRKNWSNVLKKIRENDEPKSVEVNLVTKFIKDEVESFSSNNIIVDVNVYDDDDNNGK